MRLRMLATVIALLVACSLTAVLELVERGARRDTPTTPTRRDATPACNRTRTSPGSSRSRSRSRARRRTYQLYVPAAYKGTKRVPLVFDFHGFGSNAVQQMVYGNFKPQADQNDFLIVAPDGQDERRRPPLQLRQRARPAERHHDGAVAA